MRPKKKLPKYDDIIFLDFESAKLARASMIDTLKYANKKHPESKHFISIRDLENTIYGTRVKYRIVENYEPGTQLLEENRKYGWYKRPGIYEVENGNPSAGYIFEEPVRLTR